ncbi:MAG: penicillin-binding protein 2, partial [Halomonadaceae bacterium]
MAKTPQQPPQWSQRIREAFAAWRYAVVLGGVSLVVLALTVRLFELHVFDQEFLRSQGEQRTVRTETIDAHRGMISDRNGEPLAISTPVQTLWVNPRELPPYHVGLTNLARLLEVDEAALRSRLQRSAGRQFMYLKRKIQPSLSDQVLALELPGVYSRREYRRYYPAGEVASHVVGFSNIDEKGQEGLELSFDHWLSGLPGRKRVLRDNRGRSVKDISLVADAQPGNDLQLSIDMRLQYLAYRELKAVVQAHNASGGTLVMLDVHTGEVLAMVNQPAFNPNDRSQLNPAFLRNRAITDLFEPGSTIKPLT